MEEAFWQERWQSGLTGWHEGRPNSLLTRHFNALNLQAGDTVFVPLCGAALDLNWLLTQGITVIGAEFNEAAARQVFEREGAIPEPDQVGPLLRYSSDRLTIFVGDVFDVTAQTLGPVNAVYDRAALVALALETRETYAAHLSAITSNAPQLAIVFDYDQRDMEGPPFAVSATDLQALYGDRMTITELASRPVTGPLAERVTATEIALLLR